MASEKSYLVIGGAGFLGSHIVQALLNPTRGEGNAKIAVYDLVEPGPPGELSARFEGVDYHSGDILDEENFLRVLNQTRPSVVFHAASPVHGLPPDIYYRVNDRGTRVFLALCKQANVKKVVYTSSTGVVWNGGKSRSIIDEGGKIPVKGYDAYHHTKALAERLVLDQNGIDGMLTVVLRPCGMLGERDRQLIWRLAKVLEDGQHTIQIGDNTNLVDYVYAGNAAHGHVLAADGLYEKPDLVAGQAFFITNGTPIPPWNFNRMVWKELGDNGTKRITIIPRIVGLLFALLAELWCTLMGTKTEFTRFSVRYITGTQWYSIEKARKILGYDPQITLEEGVKRTVKVCKSSSFEGHRALSSYHLLYCHSGGMLLVRKSMQPDCLWTRRAEELYFSVLRRYPM